jgi:hypothetical protein
VNPGRIGVKSQKVGNHFEQTVCKPQNQKVLFKQSCFFEKVLKQVFWIFNVSTCKPTAKSSAWTDSWPSFIQTLKFSCNTGKTTFGFKKVEKSPDWTFQRF